LGVLVAIQFNTHYLPGLVCALVVALLWIGRPWSPASDGDARVAAGDRWRAIGPLALSVGVFALLALSPMAWLALDAPNHALHDPELVELARENYRMKSPFVLMNRVGWLAPWLEQHRPESLEVGPKGSLFAQRSYLGAVALVVIIAGAAALRRAPVHRGWFAFFGTLFLLQYWLAMGSHPLLWQLARSFHWSASTEQWLARMLLTSAALSATAAGYLALRRRCDARARRSAVRLLWMAAVLAAVPLSLFTAAEALLPPLRSVRAPAHFFDLAPFAFYAWFGVALAAIVHALRHPLLRRACLLGVALLVVVDFWPSRGVYLRGAPLAPLRQFESAMAELELEEPPVRIGMVLHPSLSNRTYSSLLAQGSGAGSAWNWVAWQAGLHWHTYYHYVYQMLTRPRANPPADVDGGNVLARVGRIRYLLDEFLGPQRLTLPPPWKRIAANQRFALWEQPNVYPPAFAARDYLLSVGATDQQDVMLSAVLTPAGVVVLSAGEPDDPGFGILAHGATALYVDPSLRSSLPPPLARKLVAPAELRQRARRAARPLLDVGYERPAPEHIALRVDAGDRPAVAFVSESYHPWWRARVDGAPAPVERAIGTFMAVVVPSGEHRVDLEFSPPVALQAAEILSRVAWVAVLGGLLVHAVKRLRARRHSFAR